MADKDNKGGDGRDGDKSAAKAGAVAGPGAGLPEGGTDAAVDGKRPEDYRYEIRTPNRLFRGERLGIRFNEGVGYTDEGAKAHASLEYGYRYYDRKSKKWVPDQAMEGDPTQDDGTRRNAQNR